MNFSITKPDDLHLHLRDGEMLKTVAPYTARQFTRATIMPNLVPPVTTTEMAVAYKQRIIDSLGSRQPAASGGAQQKRAFAEQSINFEPLMTLYLTDNTKPEEIKKAADSGIIKGLKLYPAGATTNSDSGVTDIRKIYPALEAAEEYGLLFLVHGEVTDKDIDIFDREAVFIERSLAPLTNKFKDLKIVMEHVTTRQGADFVNESGRNIAATITPQHLLFNRNDMLVGGMRPHFYCLPILKREEHRKALASAALSDSGKFFAGTDSAPHAQHKKETSCGCAGCFTAITAVELYAKFFDEAADLGKKSTQSKFQNFMSRFGADFYGLEYNKEKITLEKSPHNIPDFIDSAGEKIIPFLAGEKLEWKVK